MNTQIKRHPDAATLLSFAAGTLAEALAAVVSAHAATCKRCRRELSDLDIVGGFLLSTSTVADPETALPLRVPPKPPMQPLVRAAIAPAKRDPLPATIAEAYGLSFDTIPWKRLGPGVWHHKLALSEGAEGDLRLLKISPGRMMPDHGHCGAELNLVLDGAFSDATGAYGAGDLQDVDEEVEHKPLADPALGCICLIASERPARFKGFFGRLLQPLTGM